MKDTRHVHKEAPTSPMQHSTQYSKWSSALECVQAAKNEGLSNVVAPRVHPYFSQAAEQLDVYTDLLYERNSSISQEQNRAVVNDTKLALKFSMNLLALPDDEARSTMQLKALQNGWDSRIFAILSSKRGDPMCRTYAARVLCNFVTTNAETASSVLDKVAFAPTEATLLRRIRESSGLHPDQAVEESPKANWADFLICSAQSGNREAVASTVAALYNMFSALPNELLSIQLNLAAENNLLISTLLRQVLSVTSLKERMQHGGKSLFGDDFGDQCTEWILHMLEKLCRAGKLSHMYNTIARSDSRLDRAAVLPEQVVLLHCIHGLVQVENGSPHQLLGCNSVRFLAHVFSSLRAGPVEGLDETDLALRRSAQLTATDTLAEILSGESAECGNLRSELGRQTTLLRDISKDFAILVDTIRERNEGRKVREMEIGIDAEQSLTSMVRLLGNLCFGCRLNQDLLRTTLVPLPRQNTESMSTDRNVLHVLLTCTSFAYLCFTLREWAVIAIRNALEDNVENQALVAELEAREAVQSGSLEHMGVRVNLDRTGKVQVVPLETKPEDDLTRSSSDS